MFGFMESYLTPMGDARTGVAKASDYYGLG